MRTELIFWVNYPFNSPLKRYLRGFQHQKVDCDYVYESVRLFLSSHHTITTRKMTHAELCSCEEGFFPHCAFQHHGQQSTLSTDHDYNPYWDSFCPQVLSDCLQPLSVHLSDCSLTLSTAQQKKKERLFSFSTSLCIKVWLTRYIKCSAAGKF